MQAAMRFAEEHRDWIEVHYKEAVERQRNRKTYGAEEIRNFTEKLRPVLMHRVALYAACMGVTYGKITIRNQKTRWGSCSAAGNLNFNWRLALLPEDLMNYVIVHELAHRLEMNHSARFWTQVENILPDWRERRRRLREYEKRSTDIDNRRNKMAEEVWMLQTKKADFKQIGARFRIDPVTARIIRNRGIEGEAAIDRYLNGTLDDLYDPMLLKDMERAVSILCEAVDTGKKIRIVGDYDIDGVCSTYILLQAFERLGSDVDFEIPDRIKDGYGINESIIEQAHADGVEVILTCDNGISAFHQVELAKKYGMMVVITDHHEVPLDGEKEKIPPADAVIDPKQADCPYPFPEICGAVVAYKLVQVLYARRGVPQMEWLDLLEFAAIATVGDVMKLQDENRILVKYGLKKMAQTKNLGLRRLAEKNNLDLGAITAYHIGFVIGPCLNAGGRLKTAKEALALLRAQSEEEAERLAEELKELNDTRKDMTEQGTEAAKLQVESWYQKDKVLVVFLPECHESLAGIIAGRLREYYQKPAIVLTRGEEAVKGSGRSIDEYHMFKKLTEVSDLLLKFGGHPLAAGLSLEEKNIDEFRRRLNENAGLTEEDFKAKVWIDVPMPVGYVTERLVRELSCLEPFGQGNEKPLFAEKSLRIRAIRVLGRNRNVVKMTLEETDGHAIEALYFGDGTAFEEERAGRREIDVVYYPDINEYNGRKTLQAVIRRYKFRG